MAKIPWGHNLLLMSRLKSKEERLWHVKKTIENGWSRNVLNHWIDQDFYKRQGKAVTNFKNTLPDVRSDLAQQILKDPYNFNFVDLQEAHKEKELEDALTSNITEFLLELGVGFAFMGRQYKIVVEKEESFIDLLFYHVKLKCYLVVELKARKFDPRDLGQMSFYISAVDNLLKDKTDNKTVGLLLCTDKNNIEVQYTLEGMNKPMGVAKYTTQMPTIKEIEIGLRRKSALKKLSSQ